MTIDASCCLEYVIPAEVHAIFMLRPRSGWGQWIMREEFLIKPRVSVVEYTDFYGNLCQRIVMPKGTFHYSMKCRAWVPAELDTQPLAWTPSRLPRSRPLSNCQSMCCITCCRAAIVSQINLAISRPPSWARRRAATNTSPTCATGFMTTSPMVVERVTLPPQPLRRP